MYKSWAILLFLCVPTLAWSEMPKDDGYVEDLPENFDYENFMGKGAGKTHIQVEDRIQEQQSAPERKILPRIEKTTPIDLSEKMKREWASLEQSSSNVVVTLPHELPSDTESAKDSEFDNMDELLTYKGKTAPPSKKAHVAALAPEARPHSRPMRSRSAPQTKVAEIPDDIDLMQFEN